MIEDVLIWKFVAEHRKHWLNDLPDLDKLAEAWQPLYSTLSQEQRQRVAALAIFVLRDMSDVLERCRAQAQDED